MPHPQLPRVLRAADLFLLTTEPPESFGIVLIEAMACGLPVIATDYPGVRAVVDEPETGLLVSPRRPGRGRVALRRLTEAGADGRARMGAAGRAKAEAQWNWPRLVERMDDAYRRGDRGRAGRRRGHDAARLLLVAYFYPPCRDTGAPAPGAMARHLRAPRPRVTVLTTSAYGDPPDDDAAGVVRSADAQRWRARLHGSDRVDALFDADTYGGEPHPLSKLIVPEPLAVAWAPFARHEALRLQRERQFDCVITTSPPESAHLVGRALHRRGVAWVADASRRVDLRAAAARLPHRRPAAARRAPRAPLAF